MVGEKEKTSTEGVRGHGARAALVNARRLLGESDGVREFRLLPGDHLAGRRPTPMVLQRATNPSHVSRNKMIN